MHNRVPGGRIRVSGIGRRAALKGSRAALAWAWLAAAVLCGQARAQEPAPEAAGAETGNARCFKCHADPRLAGMDAATLAGMVRIPEGRRPVFRPSDAIPRLYFSPETYAASAHGELTCEECHVNVGALPHEQRHATLTCRDCHEQAYLDLNTGAHQPGTGDGKERPTCARCHGGAHEFLALKHPRPYRSSLRVVASCVECHGEAGAQTFNPAEDYRDSTHGHGLYEKGLAAAPTCVECHGSHAVRPTSDPASPMHPRNAPAICGRCHEGVVDVYMASIHGRHLKDEKEEAASCTSCHRSHGIEEVGAPFLMALVGECSTCHLEMGEKYLASYHGKATRLGAESPAVCSSCHGYHDILPKDDPNSRVAPGNLVATCRECHEGASEKFVKYIAHLDYNNLRDYPLLRWLYLGMELLILGTMAFFIPHVLLWFQRALIGRLMNPLGFHARPRRERRIRRFRRLHRIVHFMIIVSFMGLVATGFPLKYSDAAWAGRLSALFGGAQVMGIVHRICAVITFAYAVLHLGFLFVYCVLKNFPPRLAHLKAIFGPNSLVPSLRDLKDILAMFRWFFWLGPRPRFGRWTYFEKFDYWGAFWGITVIGCSGVMLWVPGVFTRWLPGWIMNAATIVHSHEALLAASFIFMIHFFNTHLRPEKFPIDMVMLTGQMTESEMAEERGVEYDQLVAEGRLEERVEPAVKLHWRVLGGIGGMAAFLLGITLIVLALISEFHHVQDADLYRIVSGQLHRLLD